MRRSVVGRARKYGSDPFDNHPFDYRYHRRKSEDGQVPPSTHTKAFDSAAYTGSLPCNVSFHAFHATH